MDDLEYIRRCPFCGSIGVLEEVKSVTWKRGQSAPVTKYIAQCIIKGCVGHHGKAYVSKQKALDTWNMRDGVVPKLDTDESQMDDIRMDELRRMLASAIESSRK